jgi:hypothetical protein
MDGGRSQESMMISRVKLDRVHPRHDQTLALPLFDKDGDPV